MSKSKAKVKGAVAQAPESAPVAIVEGNPANQAPKSDRKPRSPAKSDEDRKKLIAERIAKLQAQLAKAQTVLIEVADPALAAKRSAYKAARAAVTAAKRFSTMNDKVLIKLAAEIVTREKKRADLAAELSEGEARVARFVAENPEFADIPEVPGETPEVSG